MQQTSTQIEKLASQQQAPPSILPFMAQTHLKPDCKCIMSESTKHSEGVSEHWSLHIHRDSDSRFLPPPTPHKQHPVTHLIVFFSQELNNYCFDSEDLTELWATLFCTLWLLVPLGLMMKLRLPWNGHYKMNISIWFKTPKQPVTCTLPKIYKDSFHPPGWLTVSGNGSLTEPPLQYDDSYIKDLVYALPHIFNSLQTCGV